MPNTTPISEDTKRQIMEMIGQGLSRAAIGRALGISASTVGRYAPEGSFDRTATAAAVQARQIDNKARRQEQVDRLLALNERILTRLEQPTYTHRVKVADATFVVTDEQVSSEDERNHVQSLTAVLNTVAKLEAIDSDSGVAAARSMLSALGDAIGVSSPLT